MADSRIKYRALPSSEDPALASEDPGDTEEPYLPNEPIPVVDVRIKWTYFLLGCAILLPWNALINATPFFLSRLVGSPFYPTFSSAQSSAYTLSNVVAQFYCTITSKQSSPSRRIFASSAVIILLVISLCLSTFIRETTSTFYPFVILASASLAVTTGYLSTAVYAGAALLGASYLQTVLSGQAAVAVAVSVVQLVSSVVSLWSSSPGSYSINDEAQAEEMAARIFFGISAVFMVATLVSYVWMTRQPAYTSVVGVLEQPSKPTDGVEELHIADGRRESQTNSNSNIFRVFRENFIFMFSITYVFAVTLAVYPAITVSVRSTNPGIHPLLFTAVHFLLFNLGDLTGRWTCSFPRLVIWSAKKILAMSLMRTIFIPLLLLCNVHRPDTTSPVSPVITSDFLFMLILLLMGYSNGYVASLSMLSASSLEHNPRLKGRQEDVDVAAMLTGSFVILGLAIGALSSFGVQAISCGCNPFRV